MAMKKSKENANGECPIYLRITIDGQATEISVKRTVKPSQWNSKGQKVSGHTEAVKMLNHYIKTFEQQVHNAHHELMKDGVTITSEILKNKLTGKNSKSRMLISVFKDHNNINDYSKVYAYISNKQRPISKSAHINEIQKFKDDTGFILYVKQNINLE